MSTINKDKVTANARAIIEAVKKLQPKYPQIMQQVKAHCVSTYGRALQQMTAEPDADTEKHTDELLAILQRGEIAKLGGKAPAGQAIVTPPPPVEVPAPVSRINPAEDEPEVPATPDSPSIDIDIPTTPAPEAAAPAAPHAGNGKEGDLVSALVALIDKHTDRKGGVTEDRVRQIVREELAKVFGVVTQVLAPKS